MNINKVLITGGAGFIGSHLANQLVNNGFEVTVLDNLSEKIHGKNPKTNSPTLTSLNSKVKLIVGSITVKEDILKAIKNQNTIIHLAAETGTGESMYRTEQYVNINIGGTALLLDLLINENHSIRKIILASSRAVYGEGKYECEELGIVYPESRKYEDLQNGIFDIKIEWISGILKYIPSDESSRLNPISVYGISKQVQEQLISNVCNNIGIDTVILRYQNVYGPGQSLTNPYTGILSIFSSLIINEKQVEVFEDGLATRDFVYIDDVVAGTILGLEKSEANGKIFNIGSGESTTIIDAAKLLKKLYNKNTSIKMNGKYRVGDIRYGHADISQIKKILGFEPNYSFEKGVEKFVTWVKKNKPPISTLEKSFQELELRGLLK